MFISPKCPLKEWCTDALLTFLLPIMAPFLFYLITIPQFLNCVYQVTSNLHCFKILFSPNYRWPLHSMWHSWSHHPSIHLFSWLFFLLLLPLFWLSVVFFVGFSLSTYPLTLSALFNFPFSLFIMSLVIPITSMTSTPCWKFLNHYLVLTLQHRSTYSKQLIIASSTPPHCCFSVSCLGDGIIYQVAKARTSSHFWVFLIQDSHPISH